MRGLGTVVNVVTVLLGTAVGLLLGRRFPERVRTTLLAGVGLVVLVIGFEEARVTRNVIFPLVAIVVGGAIGELLDLEGRSSAWVNASKPASRRRAARQKPAMGMGTPSHQPSRPEGGEGGRKMLWKGS